MTVLVTLEAFEQLEALPGTMRRRIRTIMERLRRWPAVSGAKPLTGGLAGQYRIRTGDYRLQFHVRGNEVLVVKIGHRDGFYED